MHEGGEVISSDWSDEEVMLEGITWIGLQGGAVRIDADLLRGEVTVRFAVRVVEVGSSVDEVEDDSLSIVVAVSSTCRTAKHSSQRPWPRDSPPRFCPTRPPPHSCLTASRSHSRPRNPSASSTFSTPPSPLANLVDHATKRQIPT